MHSYFLSISIYSSKSPDDWPRATILALSTSISKKIPLIFISIGVTITKYSQQEEGASESQRIKSKAFTNSTFVITPVLSNLHVPRDTEPLASQTLNNSNCRRISLERSSSLIVVENSIKTLGLIKEVVSRATWAISKGGITSSTSLRVTLPLP